MSVVGESRTCPHCGQQILRSAALCPVCQRKLRADDGGRMPTGTSVSCPLLVEGTVHPPAAGPPSEYSVLVEIRDSRGAILAKHVVGVGAVQPNDTRTFALRVEMFTPDERPQPDGGGKPAAPRDDRQKPDPKDRRP